LKKSDVAAAEAILFAAGDPLELDRLAEALALSMEETKEIADALAREMDERESGLCLVRMDGKVQFCTRPSYAELIREVLQVKHNAPLSAAALEVLAVVAYHQPISRAYIEQVRGVDCSRLLTVLCQKRLLEERGRLDMPGRPLLYGTTEEFLKCFCLESLDELPQLPEPETALLKE
jgi:segregation and condensation protein B